MKSFPATATADHLRAEHRRAMILKGQHHLERIAMSAAGVPCEPLPKTKKGRTRL